MQLKKNDFLLKALDPVLIVAGILTVAFYAVMSHPAMQHSFLHHYTTQHPVDYAIVALLIWSLVDIVSKLIWLPVDILSLRQNWLPPREGREPASSAGSLLEEVMSKPHWLRESRLGKRLTHALEFVVQKGSADEFRDHLHLLAEQDDDDTYGKYTLVRFTIGVTPVLGFLGTVIHFGTALSGISFDEMADKLPVVVSEMGQAFNTTTTALAASMSLMFLLFLCERAERGVTRQIDRATDRALLNRFDVKDSNLTPFLAAIKSANDEALAAISATLASHTNLWLQAFEGVLTRFDARQQQEAAGWTRALETLNKRHETFDAERESRLLQVISTVEGRQEQFMIRVNQSLDKALTFRDGIDDLAETLNKIGQGEGKLLELQTVLSKNLRVIHEAQKIDDALHGLTAAIHLLTARNRGDFGQNAAA